MLIEKLQKNPFVGLHKNVCTGQCWLYQIDFGSNFTYGFSYLELNTTKKQPRPKNTVRTL